MTQLDKMNFAELSQEEMRALQEAEDIINRNRENDKVFLMALVK